MNIDGVFEGGGVKGIAFVGAISNLEKKGYKFYRAAGTSAGSIIAALVMAGYTGDELKDIMYSFNYSDFIKKDGLQSIPLIGKSLSFIIEKGIFSTEIFERWMNEKLNAKGIKCFGDISNNGESKLKIIASDITKKSILVLPDDLSKYNLDPMKFSIARAVRMSISIPYFFKPVILRYPQGSSYVVDGGILSNYPIWIFDTKGTPRWPTFGFKLVDGSRNSNVYAKNNIISYSLDIINTMIDEDEGRYIKDSDFVRTITIPTCGVKTTEFDLDKKKMKCLFDAGYNSTDEFLRYWDFENYKNKYRLGKKISRRENLNLSKK